MEGSGVAGAGAGASAGDGWRAVSLTPVYVFGMTAKVSGSPIHLDTNHVLHGAGRYVAVPALDSQEMGFLAPRDATVKGITALAISPNRRFLAVGERGVGSAAATTVVDVATMTPKTTLVFGDSREVVSVAFSGDGHLIAVQTGRPDWTLLCWEWERDPTTPIAQHKLGIPVSKCSFNPWDSHFVATSGKGHLALWRIVANEDGSSGSLVEVPLGDVAVGGKEAATTTTTAEGGGDGERRPWSSHAWMLGDVLVACTEVGEILVFERSLLRQTIAPFHGESGLDCLAPLTKGIVAVGGNKVSVLEGLEDGGQAGFAVRRTFEVPSALCPRSDIIGVSIPLSETNIVCATATTQLFSLTLDLPTMTIDAGQLLADHIFGHSKGLHSGAITGLDVAVRKPLLVTTGADGTVRVWNWATKKCELSKSFKEDPLCVALHPLGLQAVVGFSDKLKLVSLLVDDIRVECTFPIKACREVRFSTGGHFIAAVSPNGVQIYSSVTCKLLATLRGHVGQVKAVAFSRNDSRLVTVSIDGAIFEWSTTTWTRIQDNVVKTCAYTAVTYDEPGTAVICAASDKMIRTVFEGKITQQVPSGEDALTAVVYVPRHKAVVAGSVLGHVRVFEYPLTGKYAEYPAHSSGVSRIRLGPDGDTVYSAGEDGTLFAFAISSVAADVAAEEVSQQRSAATGGSPSSVAAKREVTDESRPLDLVLAGQMWMRDQFAEQRQTLRRMEEVAKSVEAQVSTRMADYKRELDQQTSQQEQLLQAERARVQELLAEKAHLEARHAEEMQAIAAKHAETLRDADALRKSEVASLTSRLEQVAREKDEELGATRERLDREKRERAAAMAAAAEEATRALEAERARYRALEQKMREEQELHDAEIRQQEEEYEFALEQAKEHASHMLQVERDTTGTLERVGSQVRKRLEESQREQASLRDQVDRLQTEFDRLTKAARERDEENASLRRELSERSESVAQKERRLGELKQRNQELEKFRFVLEFKIAELKDQLGPHEATIAAQKEQIAAMNEELQRTFQKLEELRLRDNEHAQKVEAGNRQLQHAKLQLAERDKHMRTLVEALHRVYTEVDTSEWKAGFVRLYRTFVATEQGSKAVSPEDRDRMQELARQREYMEHSLEVLKTKESRQEARHRVDLDRRTTENVHLIDELNRLRRENVALQEKIVAMQNRLDSGATKAQERVRVAAVQAVASGKAAAAASGTATKAPRKSPNAAPSTTALARSKATDGVADAERVEITHLEQLVQQKDRIIDQLKDELDRLAQQLAVLATSGQHASRGTATASAGSMLDRSRGHQQQRPLSSPAEEHLPQIRP